jgi:SAM-dependent methyltransferase
MQGHRLIDGHHRAARCLEEGTPFVAYLLSEEESRAVLLRSPDPARLPQSTGTDDPREHNRLAWNSLVAQKQRLTRTASDEDLERRKHSRWLEDVAGQRMLLLGAGGGYLSMVRASAGAVVTVVDISDDMLALDRAEAAKRGLTVRTCRASMDDLSMLEPASFDICEHPVSTCYVPEVLPVYQQVARVLRPGGLYVSHHKQPTSLQCRVSPTAQGGYELTEPYYRTGPLPAVLGSRHREPGTLEFLHRWEQLLGDLCRAGFVLEDLYEPKRGSSRAEPGSFEHRSLFVAPYVAVKARRLP